MRLRASSLAVAGCSSVSEALPGGVTRGEADVLAHRIVSLPTRLLPAGGAGRLLSFRGVGLLRPRSASIGAFLLRGPAWPLRRGLRLISACGPRARPP